MMPNQYFAFDKYFVHDNAEIRNEVLGEIDYMNEIARRLSEGVDEAVENYRFGAGTEGETKYQLVGETSDGMRCMKQVKMFLT